MSLQEPASAFADAPFLLSDAPASTDVLAKYFRAFGDPTRLQILDLLAEGERSVGELVELTGRSQPKVSNHLACLRWCGFVVARREHPRVRYSIADPRVIEVIAIARVLLERNADHVACCRVLESEKGSGGGRR